MNKLKHISIISIFILVLIAIFAFALGTLTSGEITPAQPANETVIFGLNSTFFNATVATTSTVTNGTWLIHQSPEFNATTTVYQLGNVSGVLGKNKTDLVASMSDSNIVDGLWNVSIVVTNDSATTGFEFFGLMSATDNVTGNVSGLIQGIRIVKNTNNSAVNLTHAGGLTARGNYSGTLQLNVTIAAVNLTTNGTWIAINSSSEVIINFTFVIQDLNGSYGGGLADGNYNITLTWTNITDTLTSTGGVGVAFGGSVYNATVENIQIDNTVPSNTVTIDDSDAKIITRGKIKVTCDFSDATTGVKDNEVRLTKPNGDVLVVAGVAEKTFRDLETAATGTYTAECFSEDFAGNQQSVTKKFTVRARSSAPGVKTTTGVRVDYDLSTKETVTATGKEGRVRDFTIDGTTIHMIEFKEVTETSVIVVFSSHPVEVTLNIGDSAEVDLNDDEENDIKATLVSIISGRARLTIDKLAGAVKITPPGEEEVPPEEAVPPREERKEREGISGTTWIVILIITIVIVIGYFLFKGKGKGKKGQIKFSRSELKPKK